jgi:hypothetical protein
MNNPTAVIRMGAAEWSASISPSKGEAMRFDLRAMTREERREFHRTFMASYRQSVAPPKPKRRRRRRTRTRH